MNKKLLLFTLPLILLNSCGDDEPLGKLANEIDEQFTESVEIQEKWAAACRESEILNSSVQKTIDFSGDDFSEEYVVYSDASCSSAEGIVKLGGEFELDGGTDSMNLNLDYKFMSITANSQIAVDIFSAVNLCGVDNWNIGQEKVISRPGDNCFLSNLPTSKYGKVFVDDSEDKMYLSEDFALKPEDRPATVDRSLEFNEVD